MQAGAHQLDEVNKIFAVFCVGFKVSDLVGLWFRVRFSDWLAPLGWQVWVFHVKTLGLGSSKRSFFGICVLNRASKATCAYAFAYTYTDAYTCT